MAKYLVIVESPAKVKTIKKFLGANYDVEASNGHVRDFPKSQFGIDVEHDFEPKYITIRGKGELLAKLRKAAKKADKIYLATDPDREGEAISWHLMQALKEDPKKMHRITFNEITKTAVKSSIKQARDLDMDLVDAQQARRMLDRMVGYTISPLLWAKVKRGLSAGRVQSVALRIICDREDEINAFIPEEYWSLEGDFQVKGEKKPLQAKFYGTDKKMDIHSKEEMDKLLASLKDKEYEINEVKKGERIKNAPLPFTTSTLQQEAAKTLNFSTQKTMRLAQQLYEGIDIKGNGTVGVISYLRTDSTRISEEADAAAREYITAQYGEDYVSKSEKAVKKGQKIQDAHEAIRPTDISRTPAVLKESLSRDQFRLYQLIWRRFAASRMAPAKYETTSVKIGADQYIFTVSASKIIFDGFMSVYTDEEDQKKGNVLNQSLERGMKLSLKELKPEQHFTQPPAHYTEASLVKTMEELGIGRPSTYAPTITTIISRRYVAKEQKNLYVTELGEVVNNIMKQAFPSIVDVNFTIAWVVVTMTIIFQVIKHTIGRRVSAEEEIAGLDSKEHGVASAYDGFAMAGVPTPMGTSIKAPVVTARPSAPAESVPELPKEGVHKLTKVVIITRQNKLDEFMQAMNEIGVTGITITNVLGCGVQKGAPSYYRGVEMEMNLLPKVKIEIVVSLVPVQKVIETAKAVLHTGQIGDGKVFVYDIENVVKIRTGEEGYLALQDTK